MESQDYSQEDRPDALSESLEEVDRLTDSESDVFEDDSPYDRDAPESDGEPGSELIGGRFNASEITVLLFFINCVVEL